MVLVAGAVGCVGPCAMTPRIGTWPGAVFACVGGALLTGFFLGWKMLAAAFLRTVGAAGPLAIGVVELVRAMGGVKEVFIVAGWATACYAVVSERTVSEGLLAITCRTRSSASSEGDGKCDGRRKSVDSELYFS